jgi:hypothetical protein
MASHVITLRRDVSDARFPWAARFGWGGEWPPPVHLALLSESGRMVVVEPSRQPAGLLAQLGAEHPRLVIERFVLRHADPACDDSGDLTAYYLPTDAPDRREPEFVVGDVVTVGGIEFTKIADDPFGGLAQAAGPDWPNPHGANARSGP